MTDLGQGGGHRRTFASGARTYRGTSASRSTTAPGGQPAERSGGDPVDGVVVGGHATPAARASRKRTAVPHCLPRVVQVRRPASRSGRHAGAPSGACRRPRRRRTPRRGGRRSPPARGRRAGVARAERERLQGVDGTTARPAPGRARAVATPIRRPVNVPGPTPAPMPHARHPGPPPAAPGRRAQELWPVAGLRRAPGRRTRRRAPSAAATATTVADVAVSNASTLMGR